MILPQEANEFYLQKKSRFRDFLLKHGEKLLRSLESLIGEYSRIGNSTFFNSQDFSWVENVEANWMKIRDEMNQLLNQLDNIPNFQDISTDQVSITSDNRWKTYFFYAYGIKAEKNCQRCPETTRIIEQIPGMKTAFFSILLPHKHIPEHRGPYKGVVRYHLALKVPENKIDCKIRVGEDFRYWEEGKSLIFDDTFCHEVWNDTDEIRVILFLDFIRPMPFPLSLLNQVIIQLISWSPYVQSGKNNFVKWENKLG
ncbi:MAG: aspartyl/asparaginyl beta-hydroxylase domain-containing protein [Nostoc sp. DedQUE01]|nr:aspartyl/asparaginyl beta-hydroxylase domain-containing protein [Nostoc sp. DedQUE11]MDZ8076112.1 aspartyl/asparaginyl beta-hydroxylase domain-containing protein [Nostoc sp. DedQUE01]